MTADGTAPHRTAPHLVVEPVCNDAIKLVANRQLPNRHSRCKHCGSHCGVSCNMHCLLRHSKRSRHSCGCLCDGLEGDFVDEQGALDHRLREPTLPLQAKL